MVCVTAVIVAISGLVSALSPSPQPAPAPPPRVAADAGGSPLFGVNDNSVLAGVAEPGTVMERLAEIGAPGGAVYRFTVDWRNVERRDDVWNWKAYDTVYEQALARDLRPLPILLNAPDWAKGVSGACAPVTRRCISPPERSAEGMGQWRQFVAEAVRRWPRAVAIEVWNEPNFRGFWTTLAGADPAYYGELLCNAFRAARAVDGSMTVLNGGLADPPTSRTRGNVSMADYLHALYRAGAVRSCTDGLALHPYPGQRAPDDKHSHFSGHLARAREVLARFGDAGRPLWLTELGYFTGGLRLPGGRRAVSEHQQATWLTCAYRMASGMRDVRAIVLHTLFDPGTDPLEPEHNYGLNRHPDALGPARKPAHQALATMFRRYPAGVPPAAGCA